MLDSKRILVTGASSGIGFAIAKELASNGAIVGLHHRRPYEDVAAIIEEIQQISPASFSLQAELTEPNAGHHLIDEFVARVGGIDGLVNNAGAVYDYGDFLTLSRDSWDKTFALNVTAPFELMRGAWPFMEKAKYGRIVNISSGAVGYSGSLRSVHYVASKAALEAVGKTFAKDGVKHNILVNTIRLGLMDTPMHTRTPGYTRTHLEARAAIVPLGRMGKPEEAAVWVRNLLSAEGDFMTGQIFALAGGD